MAVVSPQAKAELTYNIIVTSDNTNIMKSFFAFFMLIPAPLLSIAMIENTNANNIWYHGGFLAVMFIAACIWACIKDARDY